ncbi:hypothetical protein [Tenacibaculum agarivorans]|uniref:hypothetical protein n=1 Tax=Tenacibaculum agarivorans TaxID=1908389 RepID=UPI00094B7FCE|nr:hypothetical protein [Tenacibaculum agarivorans]
MKLRTKKEVLQLNEKIKTELGIDVSEYKNEEVAENFAELLVLPSYIISWVMRPILFCLVLYVLGFYFLDLVHIEYLLYGVIGLVLFLLSGIAFGFLLLLFKMKNDIWGIADYSLDILKLSVEDVSNINNQIGKQNKKDVLSLLFKGIIHIVTIPLFTEVVSNKVPVLGFLTKRPVKKVLTLVSDRLEFEEDNIDDFVEDSDEGKSKVLTSYISIITKASEGLEKFINFTFKIARSPFVILSLFSFVLLFLFLYLIH